MQLNPLSTPQHLKNTGTLLLPVSPTAALGPAAYIPGLATFTIGSILYPNTTTTIAQLLAVAVNQVLVSGGVATAPAWSATPTLAGITCTAINPLTTIAESWIGPSSTAGIYFKGGNVGIGTTSPGDKLEVNGSVRATSVTVNNGGGISATGLSGSSYFQIGYSATLSAYNILTLQTYNTNQPIYISPNGSGATYINSGSSTGNVLMASGGGNVGIGTTVPTALLTIKAGTATASTAPLKFTSGVVNTTPETGAMEYNGTNLFFTRSGTTRETNWCGNSGAAAPTPQTLLALPLSVFGGGTITQMLGNPDSWAGVNVGGQLYKVPLYL